MIISKKNVHSLLTMMALLVPVLHASETTCPSGSLQREEKEIKTVISTAMKDEGQWLEGVVPCQKPFFISPAEQAKPFRCYTSKGAVFELVNRPHFGRAWKCIHSFYPHDTTCGPNGLIWSDRVSTDVSLEEALKTCQKLKNNPKDRLPSREDFFRGILNGFDEVLSNVDGESYWTTPSFTSDDMSPNYSFSSYRSDRGHHYITGDREYFKRVPGKDVRCVYSSR